MRLSSHSSLNAIIIAAIGRKSRGDSPSGRSLKGLIVAFIRGIGAVIRVARRDTSRYRAVRLSRNAHEILSKLAMRDKLTSIPTFKPIVEAIAGGD